MEGLFGMVMNNNPHMQEDLENAKRNFKEYSVRDTLMVDTTEEARLRIAENFQEGDRVTVHKVIESIEVIAQKTIIIENL